MFKTIFLYHVIPLILSLCGTVLFIFSYSSEEKLAIHQGTISGKQEKNRGFYANLLNGDQAEIDFIASIKNRDQLTIFGSSEFTNMPYVSYNFLPDTLGKPALGLGHAYHQELSILCELLAAYDHLDSTKICIILSPGWFETNGTNTEAFIEFVRPNFLTNIALSSTIPTVYKQHIGKYIDANYELINGVSRSMSYLRKIYLQENACSFGNVKLAISDKLMPPLKLNQYSVEGYQSYESKIWNGNFAQRKKEVQQAFLDSTNNELFVYNHYYKTYLLNEDGSTKFGHVSDINYADNAEFKDFNILLQLLQEKNVQASFVMQPMNPYYYNGLELNVDLVNEVVKRIKNAGYPCLNMYVTSKEEYQPGILKDVMHLGDFGWLTINEFLVSTYYE